MTIKPLEAFRTRFPACELVLLADISALTILAWDGALKWPQEQLDGVCSLAAEVFGFGVGDEGPRIETGMIARATGCYTFARAAPGSNEILCSVFAPGADISGVMDDSRALCRDMLGFKQVLAS